MDFEQIKSQVHIRDYADALLEKRGRDTYVCPSCGSGTGPKRTAAFHLKDERFKCFSCGIGGDVFDLAGIVNGTEDKREQARAVADWAGIRIEDERPVSASPAKRAEPKKGPSKAELAAREAEDERARREAAAYIEACRANIDDPEAVAYIERRGFTFDEARAFGWGYDPAKHGLVLPYGPDAPYYYTRRDLRKGTDEDGKYYKPKGIDEPRNCVSALDRSNVVFVTEGLMDAFAVMACGFEAISLNSTSNATETAKAIIDHGFKGCVSVLLDADDTGRKAAALMADVLKNGGISAVVAEGLPDNDPGDAFVRDRSELAAFLALKADEAASRAEEDREARYAEAMRNLNVLDPVKVMQGVWRMDDYEEPTPTGLMGLDRALDGGFRRGVVVIGAVSSMGKTTLAAQIADNIAASGRGVLFVTIEQSAEEIVAKSLSRIMRAHGYAVPYHHILGAERRTWGKAQNEAFFKACEEYANMTVGRLRIIEGINRPSVQSIWALAAEIAEHDGKPPVIFIDYLQLLAPQSERDTDKQTTDKNMTLLRQMANKKNLGTTVVVISSLNRSSYSGVIDLDSFKESGGIEYGADVLLGLQPYNMKERIKDRDTKQKAEDRADEIIKQTKSSNPRECEIVVLKNRSGETSRNDKGVPVCYYPVSNVLYDGREQDAPSFKFGEGTTE